MLKARARAIKTEQVQTSKPWVTKSNLVPYKNGGKIVQFEFGGVFKTVFKVIKRFFINRNNPSISPNSNWTNYIPVIIVRNLLEFGFLSLTRLYCFLLILDFDSIKIFKKHVLGLAWATVSFNYYVEGFSEFISAHCGKSERHKFWLRFLLSI